MVSTMLMLMKENSSSLCTALVTVLLNTIQAILLISITPHTESHISKVAENLTDVQNTDA